MSTPAFLIVLRVYKWSQVLIAGGITTLSIPLFKESAKAALMALSIAALLCVKAYVIQIWITELTTPDEH